MKKALIISTSPCRGGNSDLLVWHFANETVDAGNDREVAPIAGKNLNESFANLLHLMDSISPQCRSFEYHRIIL